MTAAGPRWWKSAGVRFGLTFAVLVGLSALADGAFLWWSTAGFMERQTDQEIAADAQFLAEAYLHGDLAGLRDAIENRENNDINDESLYLLVGRDLSAIAGNLPNWPHKLSLQGEAQATLSISHDGMPAASARLHSYLLDGGLHLLIGRDVHQRDHMAEVLTGALLWSALVMLLLGLAGAFAVRSVFARMLANVSATTAAIAAGDLGRRVRLTGRGDELDRMAETINDMLDRMNRLMDGVRQVSNAIAHDLRTPITRARARLEDAQHASRTEAELRAGIERALADLDGVADIFQALLRIAEIESGSRRAAFARFDLATLLRDLAELYEAAAEERGLALQTDVPGVLTAYGDRGMLQQAVANLLDNAVKFSSAGGTVRLSAIALPGGPMAVSVSDQGPGIPEADRPRATERFFRGETARHAPGSGLGLALVQAVAALHGGTLRLEDNAPGLRAVLLLPAPPPPPPMLTLAHRMDEVSPAPDRPAIASGA